MSERPPRDQKGRDDHGRRPAGVALLVGIVASLTPRLHAPAVPAAETLVAPRAPGSAWAAYSVADWKRDWPGCRFEDGVSEGRVSVVESAGAAWWRVAYAAKEFGPERGGAAWRWPFADRPVQACELEYRLRFDEGFDFVKGGKLPGLCGGPDTITGGDACDGTRGWSVRLMWRRNGRGQVSFEVEAAVRRRLGGLPRARMRDAATQLRPRELEVFERIGKGMTTQQIADSLGISVHTVNTHRKAIVSKLGAVGAELVRLAAIHNTTRTAPVGSD